MAYKTFSAGFLVKNNKVFLVHHKKFDKWTPPGGRLEENETYNQALIREWHEELGLDIEIIPAHENAFAGDDNSTPIPMPFHIDLEREGFKVPHIGHFFYVKLTKNDQEINLLESELLGFKWFSKDELKTLKTFDQVRALAAYAINHYPLIK